MKPASIFVLLLGALTSNQVLAQEGPRGLGLQLQSTILAADGVATVGGGAGVVYDTGPMRFGGLLGLAFIEDGPTLLDLAGRFFYALHQTQRSDLSLGGGLTIGLADPPGGADSQFRLGLEFGLEVRMFVVENVAVCAFGGLGLGLGDGDLTLAIRGQLLGSLGLSYFF